MTAAFLAFLPALAGAALLTYAYDPRARIAARLAAAAPLAIAALGLIGYALAAWFGLNTFTSTLAALALLALGALAATRAGWSRVRASLRADRDALARAWHGPRRPLVVGSLYVVLLGALLFGVFDRAILDTPEGLATGVDHNLGDLPFHLSIVSGFVHGRNYPPEHPELAGVRLTYPFGIDMAAALQVAAGASCRQAFLFQDLLLAASSAFLLWRFTLRLTGDGRAALLAPLLVFLSGGLGFVWFLRDLRAHDGPLWDLLARLPRDYTMLDAAGIRWGNALTTLLIPQRAFLLGLPLFLLVATLWWDALHEDDAPTARRLLVGAGVLAGLFPLAHAHGFVVCLSVAALIALIVRGRRRWLAFFVPALLLGLPQVAWMAHGSSTRPGGFVAWHVGWDHGPNNPLVAWLLNAGVFLVLYLAGLVVAWRAGQKHAALFVLAFAPWFVIPNLLRLSPWIWDNVKFLFYWFVASAPLAALALARLSRGGKAGLAAAVLMLAGATASGALDTWRVASRSREHVLFDREATLFAARMIATTPPRALILHFPSYNSPVLLTGRRSLLGYPGHIWSQGLDAGTRAEDLAEVYAGGSRATDLVRAWGADYALVGPQERAAWPNRPSFVAHPLLEGPSYRLQPLARSGKTEGDDP